MLSEGALLNPILFLQYDNMNCKEIYFDEIGHNKTEKSFSHMLWEQLKKVRDQYIHLWMDTLTHRPTDKPGDF